MIDGDLTIIDSIFQTLQAQGGNRFNAALTGVSASQAAGYANQGGNGGPGGYFSMPKRRDEDGNMVLAPAPLGGRGGDPGP